MRAISFEQLLPLYGSWTVDTAANTAIFSAEAKDASEDRHGLALLGWSMDDGVIECKISLPKATPESGAMIVLRAKGQEKYLAAGLGGWGNAYTLNEGTGGQFRRLGGVGNSAHVKAGRDYNIRVAVEGQKLVLNVDRVPVLTYSSLPPTGGVSIGLLAFRSSVEARFRDLQIDDARPKAFIVMQFSSPYNEVYRDAIQPLVAEIGFDPVRVDDVSQPGIIINDIRNLISESSVILADISEANPNVYYEVGMAHATDKPTILLAQRGTKLPFDVGPHRCIFYDNTIPGRAKLQEALKRSLETLLGITISNGRSGS